MIISSITAQLPIEIATTTSDLKSNAEAHKITLKEALVLAIYVETGTRKQFRLFQLPTCMCL